MPVFKKKMREHILKETIRKNGSSLAADLTFMKTQSRPTQPHKNGLFLAAAFFAL